jgi:hypothetical protein
MASVIITMTIDTDTVNQTNLGTTIIHSVSGGTLNKHVPTDSQLDEIVVNTGDSLTFQLQPQNGDARLVCNVLSLAAKQNGNVGTTLGGSSDTGPDNRKVLSIASISGLDKSSLLYSLALNIKGTNYAFDPKMTIHIVHP